MKLCLASSRAAALLCLLTGIEAAHQGHNHHAHHQQHESNSTITAEVNAPLEKKSGSCKFPSDAGLVAITPTLPNAGWAMSPDQSCKPGNYCPYACPSGQLSMQWDPKAKSYSYPMSMNGGLYCDENGELQKPFPDRPYCQDGTGALGVRNECGAQVSFCQTVLPGNEAMLIPTLVTDIATLAVPNSSYWCETSSHFFINPPGINTDLACAWGTSANPYGNWASYVAGANTDSDGNTYVKLGWNPIYLESSSPFRNTIPNFGAAIECDGDGCTGLPCKIDPAVNGVDEITGETSSDGAGSGSFCVVTVPKGKKANVVVFNKEGFGGPPSSSSSSAELAAPTSSVDSAPSTGGASSASSITAGTASSTDSSSDSSSVTSPSWKPSSANSNSSGMATSICSASASPSYTYEPHHFLETGAGTTTAMQPAETASLSPSPSTQESGATSAVVSLLSIMLGVCAAAILSL